MSEVAKVIYEIIIWLFLMYAAGIFTIYTWIAIFSYGALVRYKQGNVFTDYSIIATNPNAPSFSLIAPAYNEGITIVENVRSLLSIYYHRLEIIIVNDGSKDDSIERLVKAYHLVPVPYIIPGNLSTQEVKQVYKSTNPAFRKLIVVDKKNGGKADALNVGINISKSDYIVCIDVDCIIEQDAVLKLAKPFMEQTDERLIACGGVIRLANNCRIEHGKVLEVNLPKSWLGRSQALEYIRAFVLGRMAWSRASGLILISGAFGAFDKEIVLACGGYDHATVGEDMELVVRMRRYMIEQNLPHQVINIPDPLCWTEVPEDKEVLKKQRNRWMRGTMETLWKHRKLMFNPRYGKLGMISLPYWFFFEFLGPFVEFSGYAVFWIFVFSGTINWSFFIALYALVVFSSVLYSSYAIAVDLVSRQVYSKQKDMRKLILTAVFEPFYFHPLVTWAGIRGMVDYFRKKSGWGEMTRQGFSQEKKESVRARLLRMGKQILQYFSVAGSLFIVLVLVFSVIEWLLYGSFIQHFKGATEFFIMLGNNMLYSFTLLFVLGMMFGLVQLLNRTLSKWLFNLLLAVLLISQLLLAFYFSSSRNLLGSDLFFYSAEEIKNILESSQVLTLKNILALVAGLLGIYSLFHFLAKKWKGSAPLGLSLMGLGIISILLLSLSMEFNSDRDESVQTAEQSKLGFFVGSNTEHLMQEIKAGYFDSNPGAVYAGISADYPFLKQEQTKDVLGPLMVKTDKVPNLVLIIVEGLGNAYSDPKGYIGDFTPFLSSLKDSSMVWENALSSSGRTFSALPTLLGSLPFASAGFLEQADYPDHFNLLNVLRHNRFQTSFIYGGDVNFDYMAKYLEFNQIDRIIEQGSFPKGYRKLPSSAGESWGYEDQAVLDQLYRQGDGATPPYFHIALTLSTHNPFLINDEKKYADLYEKRLQDLRLTKEQRTFALANRKQLISVMNVDDALREFFSKYATRAEFKHTIFVITGDHAMPEIPLQSKIDRYHVPLILYSKMLKEKKRFTNIVSHFDFAPSLLAYYRQNYGLKVPQKVTWIGKGLDIGGSRSGLGIPIMQSKSQLIDFVYDGYHINDQKLFQLDRSLNEDPVGEDVKGSIISDRFEQFRDMNKDFIRSGKLMPDSVYQEFFKQ